MDFTLRVYTPPLGSTADFSIVEHNFLLSPYTPPASNAADFSFGTGGFDWRILADGITGKLGRPDLLDPLGVGGIYQRRMTKRGKVSIKMKYYTPTNPRTVPQQANRAKFAAAMAAWGGLTSEQKAAYTKRAKRRGRAPWGLFIREYYQS